MNQSILEAAKEILLGEAKQTFKLPQNEKELMAMVKNAKNIQTTEEDDAGRSLLSDTPKNVSKKLSLILKKEKPWSKAYDLGYDGEDMGSNPFRQGTLAYDLWSAAWDAGDDYAFKSGHDPETKVQKPKVQKPVKKPVQKYEPFELPKDERELMAMIKNSKNIQTTEVDDAGSKLLSDTPKNVSRKLKAILKKQKPWTIAYDAGFDGEGMGSNPFRQGTLAYDLWSAAWEMGDSDNYPN